MIYFMSTLTQKTLIKQRLLFTKTPPSSVWSADGSPLLFSVSTRACTMRQTSRRRRATDRW